MQKTAHIGLQLVTDAASEPVSLADAKDFLHIDSADTSHDALVTALITASRKACENWTKLAFINQTWNLTLDGFPIAGNHGRAPWWDGVREGPISLVTGGYGVISIPKAPLASVTSISWWDTSDTQQTMDLSTINVDTVSIPGRVFLKIGQVWPTPTRAIASVQVQFVAGFGASATNVPADIITAIKLMTAHHFENRTPVMEGRGLELPYSVQTLLGFRRVTRV